MARFARLLLISAALFTAGCSRAQSVPVAELAQAQAPKSHVITNDDLDSSPDRGANNGQVFDASAPAKDDAAPQDAPKTDSGDSQQPAAKPGSVEAARATVAERDAEIQAESKRLQRVEARLGRDDEDPETRRLLQSLVQESKRNLQQLTEERNAAQQVIDSAPKDDGSSDNPKSDSAHQDDSSTSQN